MLSLDSQVCSRMRYAYHCGKSPRSRQTSYRGLRSLKQELPLPFLRIALELEAPLHLLAPCAGKIGVVERGIECSVLFIPVGWQSHHLFLGQTVELLLKVLPADSPGNGGEPIFWSLSFQTWIILYADALDTPSASATSCAFIRIVFFKDIPPA